MAENTNISNDNPDKLSQESEFIAPAQIGVNLYKPLASPGFDINTVKGKADISNPSLRIKDTTTGSAPNYPKSVTSSGPDGKKYSKLAGIMGKVQADLDSHVDNNAYNKIYSYDASSKGAHKARYKAYGQETYDKIGFSPEIDNNSWFNENLTWYDDAKKWATHAAWPMLKLGFMAPLHSYGKLFGTGDIGQDLVEARDYEEYNAIGYSTRGGIGGFAINLANSAAYSVGILTESLVEGLLIGGAVGAVSGEGVGAIPGAVVGGVVEGANALFKLPTTLFNMSKNLGKMAMNLKKLETISATKSLFARAGTSMGNFINPLNNTTEALMKYAFKNPDDLTNLARTARTAGALWHDVKNINAALSEGRLEGGFTEQRTFDTLYNNYYEKYNVAPTDDLQKQMRSQAKVAGFQNTWKNTLLVNYSNKIAFPSITRAGFMKGLPSFSKSIGKIGAEYNLVFKPGKKVSEALYSAEKISLKNSLKALTKPATYGKTALSYFKANLVEGFQETAQDVLSDATENYYINSFQNKDRQNFEYSSALFNTAIKKQISMQGFETFASGFAMGSILSIPGGMQKFLTVGYNKYYKHRSDYDSYIQEREDAVNEIVDTLNDMGKSGKDFFDPRMTNYTTQMLVGKVAASPEDATTKEAKDASFAGFHSLVQTSLRNGTFDLFLKNFEGYKQASPEDLEEAWSLEPGQGQKALLNIDKAISSAKTTAARWQFAKNKLKHVINPGDYAENTPEREQANIYNEAYLQGINNLVFASDAYDNNAGRLGKIYSTLASIPTIQNSRFSDIASITDPVRLKKEIAMLRTDVELTKDALTPEAKEQHVKQKDLLEKLENYQQEQVGATVDYLVKIKSAQKEIMASDKNLSADEAQKLAIDQVSQEYDDAEENPFESYKESFNDLLHTLAGSEENKVKLGRELDNAGGIENIFEMLMDTHALRNENMNLNKFVNLLNSPKDFYEHVQRNFDWMKKLYDNRQSYYEDVINNSLTAIQRNTLLEDLADEGIFVDLEEFAKWCEDNNNRPTYFIDQVNKRVINKDSYLYDKYIEKFEMASEAETTHPPIKKSDAAQKLDLAIKQRDEQRDGELTAVRLVYDKNLKELLGYTELEIDEMRTDAALDSEMSIEDVDAELDLITKSIEQLDSDNYIEIQAVKELAAENKMFTVEDYNALKEDIFSNDESVAEISSIASKFQDAEEEDALEAASDVLILKPLLEKRSKALTDFKENNGEDKGPKYEGTKPNIDYTNSVDEINEKYDDLIADLIAKFNAATKADVNANRPEVMKNSIQEVKSLFSGKEDIVQTKRNYIINGEAHQRMSNRIKSGYDTYNYTGEAALVRLYDETIGKELEAGATLDQEMIDNFMENLEDKALPGVNTNEFTLPITRDALETLISPKGTRLTKKTQDYIKRIEEEIEAIDAKLATVKDSTRIATLERQKQALTDAIKDEQTGRYDEAFEMTSANIKSFILNTVKENAYQESRDGGDTIDKMLKNYLDTDTSVKPEFNSKVITKEAFDALFDEETGYLTQFKKMSDAGEIFIMTKNLLVHDNNIIDANGKKLPNVAGEIDMIIVDRKGRKFIVDLKTGKVDKWLNYKVEKSKSYGKQLENTIQQTGYAHLAENMSGDRFGIKIFPLQVGYDDKGKIVTAGKPLNPALLAGEEVIGDEGTLPYTISLNGENKITVKNEETNAYETISINDFMQKLIPVKKQPGGKTSKTPKTPTNVVIPVEEQVYVDMFMNNLLNAGQLKKTTKKADIERIEIPRYFTFGELGGAKGKSGKALSSVEADKNDEIAENFKKQLQEGDKLIEPNGTVTYFRNGKVVKPDGSPYGMVDIPAFINGVTIERNAELDALGEGTEESSADEDVFNDILKLYDELNEVKPRLSKESYNMLKEQLDMRASLLFDETGNIVLKPGEIYIFTEAIKKDKITKGYRVKIDSFNPQEGTVTVSRVGPGRKSQPITMSIKDFNEVSMNEEAMNNLPKAQEVYEPTPEEIENITDGLKTANDELSDYTQRIKWNEEAAAADISSIKDDFFTNFKC